MIDIKGKTAFVTGASRGIGQEIARGLAQLGCHLIIHASRVENLADTMLMLQPFGVRVTSVACDLEDLQAVQKMLIDIDKKHPVVDIVYNNAAISCEDQPIYNSDIDVWERVFRVNVLALIKICEHFLPRMTENGFGRLINLSSGVANQPHLGPYAVSKAAVDKYTMDMAGVLAGTDVLMNRLTPGWIQTDMGGPEATDTLDVALPGVLIPALLDKGSANGRLFDVRDYIGLSLS